MKYTFSQSINPYLNKVVVNTVAAAWKLKVQHENIIPFTNNFLE